MKLTILNTFGLLKTGVHCDQIVMYCTKLSAEKFLPPDLFNLQRAGPDGIVKKLVWSGIIGEKPITLRIAVHFHLSLGMRIYNVTDVEVKSADDSDDCIDILKELRDLFKDEVKISVYIAPVPPSPLEGLNSASASDCIIFQEDIEIDGANQCFFRGPCVPDVMNYIRSSKKFHVTVIADVPDDHERIKTAQRISVPLQKNKRMLEEGLESDVEITAQGLSKIQAHKSFLIASSRVFQAMLGSGFIEGRTNHIQIPELPAEVLRAFLHFLYYGDQISPETDIKLAYYLYIAAHKYEVSDLEDMMLSHFLKRKDGEFEVQLAFSIYLFVSRTGTAPELKAKVVHILRRKIDELKLLPAYENLFRDDPRRAMEMFEEFARPSPKRKINSSSTNSKIKSSK